MMLLKDEEGDCGETEQQDCHAATNNDDKDTNHHADVSSVDIQRNNQKLISFVDPIGLKNYETA